MQQMVVVNQPRLLATNALLRAIFVAAQVACASGIVLMSFWLNNE
jgi:hypothetical protein